SQRSKGFILADVIVTDRLRRNRLVVDDLGRRMNSPRSTLDSTSFDGKRPACGIAVVDPTSDITDGKRRVTCFELCADARPGISIELTIAPRLEVNVLSRTGIVHSQRQRLRKFDPGERAGARSNEHLSKHRGCRAVRIARSARMKSERHDRASS